MHCPPHYVSAPSTGKIFSFSFFFFCTLVIRNATSPPPDQPFTMPSVFPDTNWACEACTHPNKGGNMCVMCQTPRPPTKTPPRAGAAPPPAIEMAAASTDSLPAAFPGMPRARGGLPLLLILRRLRPPQLISCRSRFPTLLVVCRHHHVPCR